jgi:hypothetical protein
MINSGFIRFGGCCVCDGSGAVALLRVAAA